MQAAFIYDCTPYLVQMCALEASRCTGKERDAESGNDYLGARYYSSNIGRFMSPDWSAQAEPVPYSSLGNPQSLNLYAYVHDNPMSGFDADGHYAWDQNQLQLQGANAGSITSGSECKLGYCDEGENSSAQQQNGDPTLPAAVAEPAPSSLEQALKPSVSTALMVATDGLGELAEAGAALSKAAKIESLTADAEKLFPKLAEKADQLHHVIPKYLGGAKDGELAKIPAAYHQLITNEFRAIAPYGQKIQRTAEEVERILQQVYSKYPLP